MILLVLVGWTASTANATAAVSTPNTATATPPGKNTISGIVIDATTGETVIGATIQVEQSPKDGAVSGLDGTFKLHTNVASPTIICSYIGYETQTIKSPLPTPLKIKLSERRTELKAVTIEATAGHTEAGARMIEQRSMNVVNVMSARSMELAPDVTVGNIIQKMSGITTERNSSGEGQYAILRGMDKRYNYTTINGVKIPSPDNKNRFVPLDLFPSEILDRIEVSKSLTANIEGDGVGGAVNLVMKDAPSACLFHANVTTGYNALFIEREYLSFNHKAIAPQSPNEIKGVKAGVTAEDFKSDNLRVTKKRPLPDLLAGIAYGDRFFKDKLGFIVAANYQNMNRGKNSDLYGRSISSIEGVSRRQYSENRQRLALHGKFDYAFSPNHKVVWYNGYLDMIKEQTRKVENKKTATMRLSWNRQYIYNSTLYGEHRFLDKKLRLNWKGVYSYAFNQTPDRVDFKFESTHLSTSAAAVRNWSHNSDRDFAGYLDLGYEYKSGNCEWDFSAGAMFRDKQRQSFLNEYTFESATGIEKLQVYGVDWNNLDELLMTPRPKGNVGDPLNYDAAERIAAGYAMMRLTLPAWDIIAGVRAENTDQRYHLIFPRSSDRDGQQLYTDFLPSLQIKRTLIRNMNLKLTYARAINRPSYFEIVPYSIIGEEYKEKGNPQLKRTMADNVDLRWEYFPKSSDQFMVGAFYKRIQDPIEYGIITEGQDTYYKPLNMGTANNMGVEVDVMKYFNVFGIKANYTFTHSQITTDKRTMNGNDIVIVRQTRPLFGQAAHVANLSLLYKDAKHGWNAQIAGSYISKRLAAISNWYKDDIYENDYFRLEVSVEKKFKFGLSVFLKGSNLLNLPMVRFYENGPQTENLVGVERYKNGLVLERKEYYGQTVLFGLRYKMKHKKNKKDE